MTSREVGFNNNRELLVNKIRQALNHQKYSMRSLGGVAREVEISEAQLKNIIEDDDYLSKEIKYLPFTSKDGKLLIMSKERFIKEASLKVKFIDFFSSNRKGIKDA